MSTGALTSNHVNYLIWRYLQETGHGEAAVKLQRDWISDPQTLPFAQHIKSHALVVLVQKGLQYYEIEQSINQSNHRARSSPSSATLFFGPESARATSTPQDVVSDDDAAVPSRISPQTRKHGRENSTNGLPLEMPTAAPAAKRSRRSHGTDTMNGDRRGSDSMECEPNEPPTAGPLTSGPPLALALPLPFASVPLPLPLALPLASLPSSSAAADAAAARSNIDSPGAESATGADGAGGGMDVEMEDDAPAPEDARMTLTLTNGQSVGVQSDQVTELGPETITLSLPDHNVMHTAWNPRDPAVLATAGHALCRIWSVRPSHASHASHASHDSHTPKSPKSPKSPTTSNPINPINSHQPNQPTQPNLPPHSDHPDHLIDSNTNSNILHPPHSAKDLPYVDILDPSDEASLVTTMAWRPDGDVLAVATRNTVSDWTGVVSLWSKSGKSNDELPSAQDMVLIFRWSQSGMYLLGITSSGRDSSALVIWNTRSSQALSPLQIDGVVTDAAWTGDRRLTVCGHGTITEVAIEGESLVIVGNRADTENTERWTNIQYDAATRTTAVAAEESGMLGILHGSSHLRTTVAHDAEITALAFQPILDPSSYLSTSPRLLITSSLDGTVKVWDAKNPFSNIHILGLGRSTPAMAISFTPDGDLVAAANWGRILIWNAETGGMPKASWNGDQGRWQSLANGVDQDSGIGEEEDGLTHSLSWDADGRKLAYGLGSQIAIINFQLQEQETPNVERAVVKPAAIEERQQ